jgi:membrane protein implicated in regulation of membrane protease activity
MPEDFTHADAGRALDDIELRRRQVVDQIDIPAWYWRGLALGWIGLGLIAVLGMPWLTLVATVAFGAVHSTLAARVIDGRHGSQHLSVRADLVSRRVPALVIGFLLVLVVITVALALVANALGAPQPGLIASVIVAIAVLFGGPRLIARVRRRAEQSAGR